jgi:hypothetical protein
LQTGPRGLLAAIRVVNTQGAAYHDLEAIAARLKTNILLIDLENVQPTDLAPLSGRPFKIKVFCGARQTKLPRDLVIGLQPFGPNVEYISIEGIGPNALDFHIAYYIGRLAFEFPGATLYIVSKDTGFDPLIKHLETQGITCHRLPSLSAITTVTSQGSPSASSKAISALTGAAASSNVMLTPAPPPVLPQDRIQKVVSTMLTRKDAKPRTFKTLTSWIKAQLNAEATDAAVNEVITRLKQGGFSDQPDGKLIWPPL